MKMDNKDLLNDGTLEQVSGGKFEENSTSGNGGGVYVYGPDLKGRDPDAPQSGTEK